MAAGTTQVTPVGVGPSRDIFNIIGEKVKKAKDQAIEARQYADKRIEDIENTPEDELNQNDIIELETLKEKRSQKGYFFKKALKFQTTDKIRTTMGKFQRDPDLQNDPASTEKERFYAKSGMFRPGEMPDMSNREEKTKDVISYVGKGFQMIMDAIDKVKARVNRTAESTEQTSRTATSTENTTQKVSNTTENLNNATESVSNISNQEVKVQQMELNFVQDVEQKREQAQAEARSEQQVDTAGTSDVIETDQGVNPSGGILSSILNVGGELLSRGRFGRARRRFGNRIPGAGRARLGRMRAGRMMNPARRNRQYTAPIGPQPMNSPTPWAAEGGGFTPRMQSNSINLSDGGIIAPIKPKKQKKLSDGGITGLVSKFLPPPLGPMLNMMINPAGAMGGIGRGIGDIGGGIGRSVGGAVGGAFQMLTNPTKLIGEGLRAVLPMNRNTGKDIVGGDKSEIENMTKIFQLPTLVGGGIMFASIAQIAKAIPFLGAIINAAKPIIKPILNAFGLPTSVLGMIFGGGTANAATMPVNFGGGGGGGNDGNGNGDDGGGGGDLGPTGPSMTATGGSKASGNITSGFGKRSSPGGIGSTNHGGIDISGGAWTQGAPISVIKPGVVEETGDLGKKGWGRYVVVKHDDGTNSLYGHLSQINVKKGDKIENKSGAAKVIGKVGSTGTSTGAHLHFELGRGWNGTIQNKVDPTSYVDSYVRGGGNVSVDATQVAASPNGATPAVRPDNTRSGAKPGTKTANATGSNSVLSKAKDAVVSVNNIITNPVGAALSGLESFYPNFNR
jgi:murein DD-endopeptidase MepM/ murein hydrolase activator NlpD